MDLFGWVVRVYPPDSPSCCEFVVTLDHTFEGLALAHVVATGPKCLRIRREKDGTFAPT